MRVVDTTSWLLEYPDPACAYRLLITMPEDMFRDARVMAAVRNQAVSAYIRDLICKDISDYVTEHPEHGASFQGKVKSEKDAPGSDEPGAQGGVDARELGGD